MNLKYLFTLMFLFVGLFTISAQEECECDEPDYESEGICLEVIEDGETYTAWAPDECHAACWYGDEFTIVECDDWEWEDDCDCEEEDWESDGICIELIDTEFDSIAFVTWVPSECYADCWYEDYTVVEDCDDGWGWEDDCDCPEEDWASDGICVEITEGDVSYATWVPSECYAACWYEEYTVVEDCDNGWEWEDDCDCSEDDWNEEGICVEIAEGGESYVSWVPSECYAACWYGDEYTVVDCPEGGEYGECDWDLDCECEIDSEEGICIAYVWSDSIFGITDTLIEWVPNECFADCWGFVDYAVVDCEDAWDWEDEEGETDFEFEGDEECLIELFETEELTFQGFLYGLAECEFLELDECVLSAPIFDTDEEFIEYLVENCPEWFGFVMDESDGPSLFTSFGETQGNGQVSSTNEITGLQVKLLGNPVVDQVNVSINTAAAMDVQINVTSTTGMLIHNDNITLAKGEQVFQYNTTDLKGGVYNMTMSNNEGTQTIKFVVIR